VTPEIFMEKAARALASSKTLFENDDPDGACSRAYYAMFNAARAALIVADAPESAQSAKTHHGLHSAFSQYLIKTRILPQHLGADLKRVEEFRIVGDYGDGNLPSADTADIMKKASVFVGAVAIFVAG
jgi:uncharacterized protein (UPF0332 family)